MKMTKTIKWAIAAVMMVGATAQALINVRFTPVDLAKGAKEIWQLEVGPAKDGKASAKFVKALKGKALEQEALTLDVSETEEAVLDNFPKANTTALLFTGDFSGASSSGSIEGEKPAAVMQMGIHWFGLLKKEDRWMVVADPLDLSAVWAGSAAMLAECVKYIQTDPRAEVPVTAGTKFTGEEKLGNIPGKVSRIDVVDAGVVIIRSTDSDQKWEFPSKKSERLDTEKLGVRMELVCDFDGDGVLDKLVAKSDGPKLLRSQTADITQDTGELDYHSRSKPAVLSVAECDFNHDGRPDVLLSYKGLHPLAFFNRGFGTFGFARELILDETELKAKDALVDGQQAAVFVDVNGDGSQDLLAVAMNGDLWAVYTAPERRPGPCLVVTSGEKLTVTVSDADGRRQVRQVSADAAAQIYFLEPGPVQVKWQNAEGKSGEKEVVVEKRVERLVLTTADK
jgi:hypothetical protein